MINKIFNFQFFLRYTQDPEQSRGTIFNTERQGVTLLLVVVILSALMSISLGLFNVVFGELLAAGEISNSFFSLYAADQGIEKTLFRDRIMRVVCRDPAGNPNGTDVLTINCDGPTQEFPNPSTCYTTKVDKAANGVGGINVIVDSSGEYRCGGDLSRTTRRRFQVIYSNQTECNDWADNDVPPDGLIDLADPDCSSINDLTEIP